MKLSFLDFAIFLIVLHHLFLAILGVHSVDVITRVKPVLAKARPKQHDIIGLEHNWKSRILYMGLRESSNVCKRSAVLTM